MNVRQRKFAKLIDRLTELSGKDGADVKVESEIGMRLSYLAGTTTIIGSYPSDYGPDEQNVYDATVCFRIEAEPYYGMVNVWIEHWTNDDEVDCGFPWFDRLCQGGEAFTEAENIADAIEAGLTK
jgi:hypothetical protein